VNPLSAETLLEQVKQQQVRFIDLQFTDIVGAVKSVTIPVLQLPEALKQGVWFDGSSVEGFARVAESDMYLIPDTSTFAVLPWLSGKDTATKKTPSWVSVALRLPSVVERACSVNAAS
jgi:glutamine synthetase